MKKMTLRAAALTVCGALAFGLAGCGSSSSAPESAASSEAAAPSVFGEYTDYDYENFDEAGGMDEKGFWAGVTALDYVTLPEDYAAVSIPTADVTPAAEEIKAQIDTLLADYAVTEQVTDRAAQLGDTANIDYSGSVDGVVFSGGTAEGFDLVLGSNTFLAAGNGYKGFEEQIVGHTVGETFDIEVWFYDGYRDSTDADGNPVILSNKAAVFTITLNSLTVTKTPELTDAWVYENLADTYYVGTVAQLEDYVRGRLTDSNRKSYLYTYLMEHSTFAEPPKAMLDYQVAYCLNYFYQYAGYYGMSLEEFTTNMVGFDSVNTLLDENASTVYDICNEELLYQAVAEAMNLELTEDFMAGYAAYLESYPESYVRHSAYIDLVMETLNKGAVLA